MKLSLQYNKRGEKWTLQFHLPSQPFEKLLCRARDPLEQHEKQCKELQGETEMTKMAALLTSQCLPWTEWTLFLLGTANQDPTHRVKRLLEEADRVERQWHKHPTTAYLQWMTREKDPFGVCTEPWWRQWVRHLRLAQRGRSKAADSAWPGA